MAQLDVFSLAAAVTALLLAAGLLIAYAVNRSLAGFGWWAAGFALLALWLATATLRPEAFSLWIRWLSWTSFYAAACLIAHGLYQQGNIGGSVRSRVVTAGVLLLAICTVLTISQAPPHYWPLLGPIPVLVFMVWSAVLVFRAGAWGYGLAMVGGIVVVALRSMFHPAGLPRLFHAPPPPPPGLRGSFAPGIDPGPAIPLDPRPPMPGGVGFTPPPGPRTPVEHALTITLMTVIALLALALILVLRNVLVELDRMRERSTTEAMTGLLNRATFEDRAADRLRRSGPSPICLVLFDIDRFKQINDTAGHAAGDQVIARLGQLLRQLALPDCLAGRVGGEEFAVILSGSEPGAARLYAETIRAGLAATAFDAGIGWAVTVSAGIAVHRPGESLHELTARADRALYATKAMGRDRVVVADQGADPSRRAAPTALGTAKA